MVMKLHDFRLLFGGIDDGICIIVINPIARTTQYGKKRRYNAETADYWGVIEHY